MNWRLFLLVFGSMAGLAWLSAVQQPPKQDPRPPAPLDGSVPQ